MNNTKIRAMSINELREQLREYDRLYRLGHPVVSDTQYDKLFDELKRLESDSGEEIPADSPTQTVGSDLFHRQKTAFPVPAKDVRHQIPMLSIENVYSQEELLEFGNKVEKQLGLAATSTKCEWVAELKIDGVSLALIYENGKLVQGITRGNGQIGEDVTHNLDMIADVPKELEIRGQNPKNAPSMLEIRGEVYMLNSDLVLLNEEQQRRGEKTYKNTRNITTGTISLKNPDEETNLKKKQEILDEHKRRKLHFFAHSVGALRAGGGIGETKSHWDFLQYVKKLGVPVAPHTQRFETFARAAQFCQELYGQEESFLNELDFEIDGLVLKVNRFDQREQLGATGHHPRWVIAYKVEKYEAVSTLKEIRVQVGKAGTITPVAELEPVEIAGTTVSRASLHNAEEIERKDIRVGDVVVVEKAGKIIPHIVRVEKHFRKAELPVFQFPVNCPVCNSPLSKDSDGVYIRCNNLLCPAQFKEKLRYFAGRDAMNIEGLGVQLVEQFVDTGLVKTFADLYRLTQPQLLTIDRLGNKSAVKLLDQIEKSKHRELRFLINALSIRHVGGRTATILAQHFDSLEKLRNATESELSAIDEIGEVIAKSVVEFFRNENELIDDLIKQTRTAVSVPPPTAAGGSPSTGGSLSGQTIVVTGTLEHFKRNEIEDVIMQHGGKPSSSVSAKTSFVLVGKDPGSKLNKAQKLGVRIVNEPEFIEMLKPPVSPEKELTMDNG